MALSLAAAAMVRVLAVALSLLAWYFVCPGVVGLVAPQARRLRLGDVVALAAKRKAQPVDAELMEKVRRYTQMKELQRLRKEGGSFDALKDSLVNGTRLGSTTSAAAGPNGYKKFITSKGSLEKRLQAMVAYKRSTIASESALDSGLTAQEEAELEFMMEDDDGDEDLFVDEEDAEYETLVMQAIETNKLNELKRNFMLDKAEKKEEAKEMTLASEPGYETNPGMILREREPGSGGSNSSESPVVVQNDLYTPARSSWGVFERPRDISKAYGGGRAISKEEMDRMDEEYELREKSRDAATETWKSAALKQETENENAIRKALDRSRSFMIMGNRNEAVKSLESVSELCSWQSDLGGEVLLELGMALETVDRTDDARKVYGKLASVSWSSKVRRNALQLIQGLDITKQIRKDVSPRKPAMDMQNLYLVQTAIEKGLLMDTDEYRRDRGRPDAVAPWFDDDKNNDAAKVDNLRDAYKVLRRALDPLRGLKVPSALLSQAFRRFSLVDSSEKMDLIRTRGVLTSVYVVGEKPKMLNRPPGTTAGPPREGTFFAMIGTGLDDSSLSPSPSPTTMQSKDAPKKSFFATMSEDPAPVLAPQQATMSAALNSVNEVFSRTTNGTWDLVLSLVDNAPFAARRFESGDLRRVFDMREQQVVETAPTLWGLGSTTLRSNFEWDKSSCELLLRGREFTRSSAPWQSKGSQEKVQIVVYADDDLLVAREPSLTASGADMFTLWKRKQVAWNKY